MEKQPRAPRAPMGFTLAEVLVVLAIVAIMAAVLMPVLTKQLSKGDVGRVISDIGSVQTAMEAFLSDVRRIPGDLGDLTAPITASDTDVLAAPYPAGLIARWRGPYLNKETTADGYFPTGFGGRISTTIANSDSYATLIIIDLTDEEFAQIDLEIDGETSSSSGRFRRDASSTSTFRLMPTG
jgi:prepilin-type N-terminal cleavage/methylation domain-containing protein